MRFHIFCPAIAIILIFRFTAITLASTDHWTSKPKDFLDWSGNENGDVEDFESQRVIASCIVKKNKRKDEVWLYKATMFVGKNMQIQRRELKQDLALDPDPERQAGFDIFMEYSYIVRSDTFGTVLFNIPATIERILTMFSVKEFMDGFEGCAPYTAPPEYIDIDADHPDEDSEHNTSTQGGREADFKTEDDPQNQAGAETRGSLLISTEFTSDTQYISQPPPGTWPLARHFYNSLEGEGTRIYVVASGVDQASKVFKFRDVKQDPARDNKKIKVEERSTIPKKSFASPDELRKFKHFKSAPRLKMKREPGGLKYPDWDQRLGNDARVFRHPDILFGERWDVQPYEDSSDLALEGNFINESEDAKIAARFAPPILGEPTKLKQSKDLDEIRYLGTKIVSRIVGNRMGLARKATIVPVHAFDLFFKEGFLYTYVAAMLTMYDDIKRRSDRDDQKENIIVLISATPQYVPLRQDSKLNTPEDDETYSKTEEAYLCTVRELLDEVLDELSKLSNVAIVSHVTHEKDINPYHYPLAGYGIGWPQINAKKHSNILLVGALSPDNVLEAKAYGGAFWPHVFAPGHVIVPSRSGTLVPDFSALYSAANAAGVLASLMAKYPDDNAIESINRLKDLAYSRIPNTPKVIWNGEEPPDLDFEIGYCKKVIEKLENGRKRKSDELERRSVEESLGIPNICPLDLPESSGG